MQLRPIHRNHVMVSAIAYDDWQNRQKDILIMTETRPSELMLGHVLKPSPDMLEVKEGDTILFQAFNRDLGVFAFPVEDQKLMEKGNYLVFTHAVLAILEPVSEDEAVPA